MRYSFIFSDRLRNLYDSYAKVEALKNKIYMLVGPVGLGPVGSVGSGWFGPVGLVAGAGLVGPTPGGWPGGTSLRWNFLPVGTSLPARTSCGGNFSAGPDLLLAEPTSGRPEPLAGPNSLAGRPLPAEILKVHFCTLFFMAS